MVIAGVLALAATMADTIRLFMRAPDHSPLALAAWACWGAALVVPLGAALWERTRKAPVPPAQVALKQIVLGYGMAILALRVIETLLNSAGL